MASELFSGHEITIFDGAIGTELYGRGFYINRPFEELNLSAPGEVLGVHKDYINAGAQVLTTNTFSITRPQLANFDIAHQQGALLEAALKLANEAAHGSHAKIAFSMGPLGVLLEPLGPTSVLEASDEFAHTASVAIAKGNFDLYVLET